MAITKSKNKTNGSRSNLWPSLPDFFDFDKFFGADWMRKDLVPAVNIKDNPDSYEIELAAPGLRKKDFNISISNGILRISSEKEDSKEEKGENYTRKEFSYSTFSRSFALPGSVDEDHVNASYKDGVLTIKLMKVEESEKEMVKEIEVS